jgi:hypothetical protein
MRIQPAPRLIIFLILALNYFWLSTDPEESASWYCDQHCFKIGAEVIESIWDSVMILAPHISVLATKKGIGMANRRGRHSGRFTGGKPNGKPGGKPNGLWHPLSVWHGLCRSNMHRGLVNALAIFNEHESRTGKVHSAKRECEFLLSHIDEVDFDSDIWMEWYTTQSGSKGTNKASLKRQEWCTLHTVPIGKMGKNASILKCNRSDPNLSMTLPPQCINEDNLAFAGCRVKGDTLESVVKAYRLYYHAKVNTVKGGFRYFYTLPPTWLNPPRRYMIKTIKASDMKKLHLTHQLDDEGYVVIKFVGNKLSTKADKVC